MYTGVYRGHTANDEGVVPEAQDAIAVPCPAIVARNLFDQVAALWAERNPRRTAPHIATGTTLLTGIATCGTPGCNSGITNRTGKNGPHACYTCNVRVNRGGEQLDGLVLTWSSASFSRGIASAPCLPA